MWNAILDAVLDSLKVLPFLLLIYILFELLESGVNAARYRRLLRGGYAPLIGAAFGLLPQCGVSVMTAKLYDRGAIRTGTLLAVFLATSDEAFAILLTGGKAALMLPVLLAVKFAVAVAVGYAVNALLARRETVVLSDFSDADAQNAGMGAENHGGHDHADAHCEDSHCKGVSAEEKHGEVAAETAHGEEDCAKEHCHADCAEEERGEADRAEAHCGGDCSADSHAEAAEGVDGDECAHCAKRHAGKWDQYFFTPLRRSLVIFAYLLAVNVLFAVLVYFVGETEITRAMSSAGAAQPLLAGLVGLIPNCVSSVLLAQGFVRGAISFGSLFAGLAVNAGLGFVVLFRNVKKWRRNLALVGSLYTIGVSLGVAICLIFP